MCAVRKINVSNFLREPKLVAANLAHASKVAQGVHAIKAIGFQHSAAGRNITNIQCYEIRILV